MQQAYLLLHPRERSRIQIQRIPILPDSPLLRQASPRCHPSTRQSFHLSASLENSALRQASNFFFFLAAMRFPESEDAIRFFADEELAETVKDDLATILSSPFCSCTLFAIFLGATCQAGILSAANRAGMADVEQMKKIVPFVTCEITCGQNVCELVLGINVPNLNLGVQINSVKQPTQSNPVGS